MRIGAKTCEKLACNVRMFRLSFRFARATVAGWVEEGGELTGHFCSAAILHATVGGWVEAAAAEYSD